MLRLFFKPHQASFLPHNKYCLNFMVNFASKSNEPRTKAEEFNEQSQPSKAGGGNVSWLEQQIVNTWILGMETRCKRQVGLNDREQELKKLFLEQFNSLLNRYQHLVTDDRSKTHLRFACLTCAGYNVYGQWIKDKEILTQMIKAQNGQDVVTHVAQRLGQFLTVCRVNMFGQDPFQIAINLQSHQVQDLGAGFGAEQQSVDANTSDLIVQRCIYQKVFQQEGVEHLCNISCCSLDVKWFEWMKDWGIQYERKEWLANQDSCCRLTLRRNK
eukprot:TRINITY_DN26080_c0_g1_i1.p1 TRINITY_DN26080_c0_g1~~TRINITY_DN26080_c0_g1_i1.p1  ORF type:complete len:271 (+),score=12.28 TRINITY_DN26080_c0_g1_i1:54-866(+)